ncbi:hypothetical protein H0H93_003324 [Arthromyces matolae]|nr:hypothetical protein H0H93_003324 [Arthromyces matolae]
MTSSASPKVTKQLKREINKEERDEEALVQQTVKEISLASKEQQKAHKAALKADDIVTKLGKKETAATAAVQRANHDHEIAKTHLQSAQKDAELKHQEDAKLQSELEEKRKRFDSAMSAQKVHKEGREARLHDLDNPQGVGSKSTGIAAGPPATAPPNPSSNVPGPYVSSQAPGPVAGPSGGASTVTAAAAGAGLAGTAGLAAHHGMRQHDKSTIDPGVGQPELQQTSAPGEQIGHRSDAGVGGFNRAVDTGPRSDLPSQAIHPSRGANAGNVIFADTGMDYVEGRNKPMGYTGQKAIGTDSRMAATTPATYPSGAPNSAGEGIFTDTGMGYAQGRNKPSGDLGQNAIGTDPRLGRDPLASTSGPRNAGLDARDSVPYTHEGPGDLGITPIARSSIPQASGPSSGVTGFSQGGAGGENLDFRGDPMMGSSGTGADSGIRPGGTRDFDREFTGDRSIGPESYGPGQFSTPQQIHRGTGTGIGDRQDVGKDPQFDYERVVVGGGERDRLGPGELGNSGVLGKDTMPGGYSPGPSGAAMNGPKMSINLIGSENLEADPAYMCTTSTRHVVAAFSFLDVDRT